jgi:hypothetical protein
MHIIDDTTMPGFARPAKVSDFAGGGGGGGGGSNADRELVVTTYRVKTAFTGASVGDTVTCTQVIDVKNTPSTVSTIWRNQTTAADLATVPAAANLELVGSQALTDAQLRAAAVPVTDTAASGTRAYNFDQATRTAVGATSSAAVEIGTLAASREVMLIASTRCFIRFGTSTVTAANATDAALLALPADAMFHMRLPAGVTHYTVIRDTADGFIRFVPVL